MSIEVICGCMFCGKTEELIRRVRRAMVAGLKVRVFKPALDSRYHKTDVVTHYGEKIKGSAVENVAQIFDFSEGYDLIAIDEAQFFNKKLITSPLSTSPLEIFLNASWADRIERRLIHSIDEKSYVCFSLLVIHKQSIILEIISTLSKNLPSLINSNS